MANAGRPRVLLLTLLLACGVALGCAAPGGFSGAGSPVAAAEVQPAASAPEATPGGDGAPADTPAPGCEQRRGGELAPTVDRGHDNGGLPPPPVTARTAPAGAGMVSAGAPRGPDLALAGQHVLCVLRI